MYSIKEVANILGVHENTIKNWIKSGDLKVTQVKKRGRVLINESEVKRLKGE